MTFIADTSPFADSAGVRALEMWREAAGLVATRWRAYLTAEPQSRSWAFASYVAGLDAEVAAAAEIAASSSSIAA